MVILDIMIGAIHALLLAVILFLAVIIIEGIYLSKQLSSKWLNFEIIGTVNISNIISTLIGIAGVLRIVLSWAEKFFGLNIDNPTIIGTIFILIIAFFLTILLEVPINVIYLKRSFIKSEIVKYSIYSNILSYILIGITVILSP
jgi:hypothetical protein